MNKPARVMYFRDSNRNPFGCVLMQYDKDGGTVNFQVSVTNPMDDFSKSHAKELAMGRLVIQPLTLTVKPNATVHEISKAIMTEVAQTSLHGKKGEKAKFPFAAVKAARRWLKTSSELDAKRKSHSNG